MFQTEVPSNRLTLSSLLFLRAPVTPTPHLVFTSDVKFLLFYGDPQLALCPTPIVRAVLRREHVSSLSFSFHALPSSGQTYRKVNDSLFPRSLYGEFFFPRSIILMERFTMTLPPLFQNFVSPSYRAMFFYEEFFTHFTNPFFFIRRFPQFTVSSPPYAFFPICCPKL